MTSREHTSLCLSVDIRLRLAVREDLPRLEWFGQYTHFRGLFQRAFREQMNGRRLMLVADLGGFPVGQLFVQLHGGERSLADGATRAYFYAFRVLEMLRGRGIGTALVEQAEQMVSERGFRWVTIAVARDNPAARRLYERLGYCVFREDPGDWSYRDHRGMIRNVHEPCWLMEKQLINRY